MCFVVAEGKPFWVSLQLILFGLAWDEAATWEAAEDMEQPV